MVFHQRLQQVNVVGFVNLFQIHHAAIAERRKDTFFVEDKSNASAHAGSNVTSGFPEDNSHPAGHVFTAVIANAFHHRVCPAIANGETFASDSTEIRFTTGGTIEHCVSNEDVVFGRED